MKRSLLALTLAAALPFAASAAEGISYNYVEAGYAATDLSDGLVDADGFAARASMAFHPNFHVFGDFSSQEFDHTNVDAERWRVGLGYNHEISPRVDLLTRVAYEKVDLGRFGDADGWSVEAGARGALTRNLEGYALAGYQDSDEFNDDFYGRLGATVKFNPNWGLSADVKFSDEDTAWFVGPRFTW